MDGLGVSWPRYFLGKPVSKALYVFIKKLLGAILRALKPQAL
jgi:hypothetical protein